MNTYNNDCWLWARNQLPNGYGMWTILIDGKRKLAHRVMYEIYKGDIPEGLSIDHLCSVRACVNPDHLEAVTPRVNVLRSNGVAAINAKKEECVNGHAFIGKKLYILKKTGKRVCRKCSSINGAKWRRQYA